VGAKFKSSCKPTTDTDTETDTNRQIDLYTEEKEFVHKVENNLNEIFFIAINLNYLFFIADCKI